MTAQLLAPISQSEPISSETDTDGRYRAFVFDSEILHGKLVCRGLELSGFRCDLTYRVAEAIAKLEERSYDLILIDVRYSRADQVKVAAAAFANRHQAKIMAVVDPSAGEVVKTLLSYGADAIIADVEDTSILGVKGLSLLEMDQWKWQTPAGPLSATKDSPEALIEKIERRLLQKTPDVLRRIGDPFEPASMPSSLREAIGRCADRARSLRSGAAVSGHNQRQSVRERVCLTASAIPLDATGKACCDPFAVVLGDLSESGARLAHTRPIAAKRLALNWRCVTIAEESVTVEAAVVRCETVGRFYEIGVRFESAPSA
jgi:CheY-like chemotaxis protein